MSTTALAGRAVAEPASMGVVVRDTAEGAGAGKHALGAGSGPSAKGGGSSIVKLQ